MAEMKQESRIITPRYRGWAVAFAGMGVNLALGVLYSWGVFASALRTSGWTATQSQLPYMMACAVFALLMVPGGRIQDKAGPRLVLLFSAILTGIGFIFSGIFPTVTGITIFYGIVFGVAMGFGYAATTPAAIKWFGPGRRGLISGIVVSGFGLAGIYVAPLKSLLLGWHGLERTFIILGVVFSTAIFLFRIIIRNPPEGFEPVSVPHKNRKTTVRATCTDHRWSEMVRTPQFVILWAMFFFGTFAGLLILGQLSSIGQEQAGLAAGEATLIVVIYAIFNWMGRIGTGMISDRIGRKATMFFIFVIQLVSFALFAQLTSLWTLAAGTAMVAFSFGGMLASFPALSADYFGIRNLGLNYGIIFTAWGFGGVLGPFLGGVVRDLTGTYRISYFISACMCLAGAVLSLMIKAPAAALESAD